MDNKLCRWKFLDGRKEWEYECRRGTLKGALYCEEHLARVPIWPSNEEGA
jgi:formylglycine-generating enzyme required for sulfatase activity